ncbi:MAG: putative diguanylate cyclase/phosphodiesterase with sensor, partial [Actinomycetia bacterium]|nr:putative diguanylate cyclase/phosphodiesterase with sensor [Actinomycetes bacterium]
AVHLTLLATLGTDGRILVSTLAQCGAAGWASWSCWRVRPQARRAWTLFAWGAGTWGLAQAAMALNYLVLRGPDGLATVLFLPCIPLCIAGLLCFVSTPATRAARVVGLLEAVMIVTSVLVLAWVVVLGPAFAQSASHVAEGTLSVFYPLGDVVIASVVLFVSSRSKPGTRAQLSIVAIGVALFVVGDTGFALLTLDGAFQTGDWPDLLWIAGWAVVAQAGRLATPEHADRALGEGAIAKWSRVFVLGPVVLALAVGFAQPPDTTLRVILGLLALSIVAHAAGSGWERFHLTSFLEDEVEARTSYFRSLVSQSSEVVIVVEADRRVRFLSQSLAGTLGYESTDGLLGGPAEDLVVYPDRLVLAAGLARAEAAPGEPMPARLRTVHANGSIRAMDVTIVSLLHDPAVEAIVLNARDVTERDALQEELAHQAFHDELTGLPNRARFRERVDLALTVGGEVAVLFVDLDGFKAVNDALGHSAGDALLATFARRLRSVVAERHVVARLGGDEFGLLVAGGDLDEASRVAEDILGALAEPLPVEGRELPITASVGVATTATATTTAELLRDADVAMYQAKARGRSRVEVFTPEMHAAALARLDLATDLRLAVTRGELRLHYQPIVELATGRVVGAEALARWTHPDLGQVSPAVFIPLAEETGAIIDIGRWVLAEAARESLVWRRRLGDDAPPISVNVSVRQIADDGFVQDAIATVLAAGARPEWLVLELTESVLVTVAGDPVACLGALRAAGFRLAIDDFGTGYSALSYLHRLPVDELKIDQSFVQALEDGGEEAALVRMIVELGHTLRLKTVAEGVETEAQRALLTELGCQWGQGYLFARPGEPAHVLELVAGRLLSSTIGDRL